MQEERREKWKKILTVALAAAFVLSLGWGIYEYQMLREYRIETENQYKRAFSDLAVVLDELETTMAKAKVATSPGQRVLYFGQTWKGSDEAVKLMSQLPADEVGISYVDIFLNQVGDFTKVITRKVASVEALSPEEQKTFNDMHERMILINRTVQQLLNQVNTENLAWVDKPPTLRQKLGIGRGKVVQTTAEGNESDGQDRGNRDVLQKPTTSVRGGLQQLDASLQKFPPFEYKGELDTHYVSKPLGLPEGTINETKALSVAKDFLNKVGYAGATPEMTGISQGPLGGFVMRYKDAYIEVSKKGGVVTVYRDQRGLDARKLDVGKAVDKAYANLAKLGWKLVVTSTEDLGSYIQIDAVPQVAGVRLYPDKVRLMVAADNGQIVGFDATPYYAFHHSRNFKPVLSLDEARAKLNKGFKVAENRLAVISKLGTEEAFCYEFRGNCLGEEYLVYINALDGTEEKISRVINTPRGKLLE